MTHTPGPWKVFETIEGSESPRNYGRLDIIAPWSDEVKPADSQTYGDYRGAYIAQMEHQGDGAPVVTRKQALDNARFIVTACNSHDDLLAACKDASKLLEVLRMDYGVGNILPEMARDLYKLIADQIQAAITEAEGGEQ